MLNLTLVSASFFLSFFLSFFAVPFAGFCLLLLKWLLVRKPNAVLKIVH
jgi:ABC-type sulfate transport system permease component